MVVQVRVTELPFIVAFVPTKMQSWLSIFYFGWLVWAIPSNLLMQRSPPAFYLSFNICEHRERFTGSMLRLPNYSTALPSHVGRCADVASCLQKFYHPGCLACDQWRI